MPTCYITKEFYENIYHTVPSKLCQYHDSELPGFLLEHRPSGRGTWYYRYHNASGKPCYRRLGDMKALSLLDARAEAYALYRLVRDGADIDALHGKNAAHIPSLEEFVNEQYMPQAQLKKRSWGMDASLMRLHVLPLFGKKRIDSFQQAEMRDWQNSLREKGLSPCSCNRVLSLVKHVFNCAVRWGMLSSGGNPMTSITPFPDNSARERFLTVNEAQRLTKALDTHKFSAPALAIKLLMHTGARKSEILGARWEHVDFARRVLTVPLSKSGKTRHIPLSDTALEILRQLPKISEDWLFPSPLGRGHLRDVHHFWRQIRRDVGLENVRIHDLRHSFASFLVGAGHSLYEVQKILGHYDPRVTMRYAHLSQAELVNAANAVDAAIAGKVKRSCGR